MAVSLAYGLISHGRGEEIRLVDVVKTELTPSLRLTPPSWRCVNVLQVPCDGGDGEGVTRGAGGARVGRFVRRSEAHLFDAVHLDGHATPGLFLSTLLRPASDHPG